MRAIGAHSKQNNATQKGGGLRFQRSDKRKKYAAETNLPDVGCGVGNEEWRKKGGLFIVLIGARSR